MPAQPSTDVPDVITVGRVSVDLYAQEVHAAFTDPQTFRKSIGGSPTNVAVAAGRHGHHAAVVTKVGTDALGDYVIALLDEWGVDTRYVGRDASALTPVVLAALAPPEEPQVYAELPVSRRQVSSKKGTPLQQLHMAANTPEPQCRVAAVYDEYWRGMGSTCRCILSRYPCSRC